MPRPKIVDPANLVAALRMLSGAVEHPLSHPAINFIISVWAVELGLLQPPPPSAPRATVARVTNEVARAVEELRAAGRVPSYNRIAELVSVQLLDSHVARSVMREAVAAILGPRKRGRPPRENWPAN